MSFELTGNLCDDISYMFSFSESNIWSASHDVWVCASKILQSLIAKFRIISRTQHSLLYVGASTEIVIELFRTRCLCSCKTRWKDGQSKKTNIFFAPLWSFASLSVRNMRGLQYIGAGLQCIGSPKFYFRDSGKEWRGKALIKPGFVYHMMV